MELNKENYQKSSNTVLHKLAFVEEIRMQMQSCVAEIVC